jgi:hypothetical protein
VSVMAHIRSKGGDIIRREWRFALRPGKLNAHARRWVKANIDLIKAQLWPHYYDWAERAAIMEFDGGLSRAEAERQAYECVEGRHAHAHR